MKKAAILALAAAACAGCIKDLEYHQDYGPYVSKTNAVVKFLCVGMEYSDRFGACPGCAKDAMTMTTILSENLGYSGTTLISNQATKYEVVKRLKDGISSTPENGLFLFCYSGHGGQEYLGGKEPDGADRQDEFLCLYDTYMQDDEIWDIVSKCKGRVFLYFDACHSATMYRSVSSELKNKAMERGLGAAMYSASDVISTKGFTFRPRRMSMGRAMSANEGPSIMCWSGCEEKMYSYGGSYGGVMTSALSRRWRRGMSYADLWPLIVRDVVNEQPTQKPQQTLMGGFSDKTEAFK